RRHTRFSRDWSSDVCSSDLELLARWWDRDGEGSEEGGERPGRGVDRDGEDEHGEGDLEPGGVDAVGDPRAEHRDGRGGDGEGREIGRASCRERVWRAGSGAD